MATPKKMENGTYVMRVCLIDKRGKRIEKYKSGFRTQKEAFAWEKEIIEKNTTSVAPNMRFFELCDYFITVRETKVAKSTIAGYKEFLAIVKSELGNVLVDKITTRMLQNLLDSHIDKPGNYAHVKSVLSCLFNFAYRQEIIDRNPFDRVEKITPKKAKVKFYSTTYFDDLVQLIKNNYPKYYTPTLLLGAIGLRPGEMSAAKECNIDMENMMLTINESYSRFEEENDYLKAPKTEDGVRKIPLTEKLLTELLYYKSTNKIKSEFLCCNENGEMLTPNALKCFYAKLCEIYNLEHFTLYSLRHTFGNACKHYGIDSYTTSRLMGHSDPYVTEKFYYGDDVELNSSAINAITQHLPK